MERSEIVFANFDRVRVAASFRSRNTKSMPAVKKFSNTSRLSSDDEKEVAIGVVQAAPQSHEVPRSGMAASIPCSLPIPTCTRAARNHWERARSTKESPTSRALWPYEAHVSERIRYNGFLATKSLLMPMTTTRTDLSLESDTLLSIFLSLGFIAYSAIRKISIPTLSCTQGARTVHCTFTYALNWKNDTRTCTHRILLPIETLLHVGETCFAKTLDVSCIFIHFSCIHGYDVS